MTLNHSFVLHCHLSLRLPTFKTVSLHKLRSARWHRSGKAGSTGWAQAYGEGHICPLGWQPAGCVQVPLGGRGLGDGQRWHTGSWALPDIPVSGDPPAAVGSRAGSGWGAPHGIWCTAGGVHVVLLWTEACRWLFIPVKPKALRWSQNIFGLYKLSWLWQHFSKLESQTKGTFMLECRRFTNS